MKRTTLRLSELNSGDIFYFFDDKKRVAYRCLGQGDAIERYNYTIKTMRIQEAAVKNPRSHFMESASRIVVKVVL